VLSLTRSVKARPSGTGRMVAAFIQFGETVHMHHRLIIVLIIGAIILIGDKLFGPEFGPVVQRVGTALGVATFVIGPGTKEHANDSNLGESPDSNGGGTGLSSDEYWHFGETSHPEADTQLQQQQQEIENQRREIEQLRQQQETD